MIKKVGFIGLGTMGAPMATNLLAAGYCLRAYDLRSDAVEKLEKLGAVAASSVVDACRDADVVITMLPNGDNVESALFDSNTVAAIPKRALYIDMSTILPSVTDRIGQRLAKQGVAMIDAPVGRSSQHAVDGKLLIMVGGSAKDVEYAKPLLDVMGDTIVHCGPLGAGERMKIVNNYMSISLNVLTAESLLLAQQCGLDAEQARQVMLGTVAGQGHMGTTYPAKVLKGDVSPGFMVDLAHKDLGLALETAAQLNSPVLMGSVAREIYGLARAKGRGRQDWTSLYTMMRESVRSGSVESAA